MIDFVVPRVMFPPWINEPSAGTFVGSFLLHVPSLGPLRYSPVLSLFLGVVSTAATHHPSLTLSLCSPRDVRSH